ncbi:MAG: hypothetical protein M1820_001957 [Bogoriella megaspora]|nr:MAG: hypothetical protein M1820_001957 [Bogoriella megaspora]
MADSDEDEDLKQAIKLSLEQEQHNTERQDNHEIQTSSRADPDAAKNSINLPESITLSGVPFANQAGQSSTTGLLGLDRKTMEQERLARLRSRKNQQSISPPPLRRDGEPASNKRKLDQTDLLVPQSRIVSNETQFTASDELQYPNGIVRRTWAFGHERQNDIKIEEVLQKSSLKVAVLSAFQWDIDWVLSKCDINKTKFVFVMQAKDEAYRQKLREDVKAWPFARLCLPPMPGQVNCMHSKLMLLFHTNHLRIAVPSANLMRYDWGETGVMENSVFLIDLPRLPKEKRISREELTLFGKELLYFVDAMGLQEDAKDGMLNFDFSKTAHLAFVHTIGGSHPGHSANRTGYPCLSNAIKALGLQTESPINLDFVASSLGSLNIAYLKTVYTAAQGLRSSEPSTKPSKADFFTKVSSVNVPYNLKDRFRIYFPTDETVRKSTGGADSGGTICFQSRWYDAATFPKDLMRDYRSKRKGLLSHNKIMYVRGTQSRSEHRGDDTDSDTRPIVWAYLGSANLSESAWGKMVADKETKGQKLSARNWECGVVILVDIEGSGSAEMDVFENSVGLPFDYPAERYEGRKPWFFQG